jgi:hypothetical protein
MVISRSAPRDHMTAGDCKSLELLYAVVFGSRASIRTHSQNLHEGIQTPVISSDKLYYKNDPRTIVEPGGNGLFLYLSWRWDSEVHSQNCFLSSFWIVSW